MAVPLTQSLFLPTASLACTKLPLGSSKFSIPVLRCSKTTSSLSSEQEILKEVLSNENTLPCVRTYESDLARLTVVGGVRFDQALTAAAADGGRTASEHVDSGSAAMVVESVFPGPGDDNATISTRLFLPAGKVKEKAKRLRKSLSEDIMFSDTPRNILSMTFRQVVIQELWNFELVLFRPGTVRDMTDLEATREVPGSVSLSASNEQAISVLAEVVCISALQSTERHFLDDFLGRNSSSFFQRFRKPKKIVSKDSSVIVYKLFEDEIVENAKSLLETFSSMRESLQPMKTRCKHQWWTSPAYSKLEKIGGPEFAAWASEYAPAYGLQIEGSRLKEVKFEGWRKAAINRWEILLTHSQMVGLADLLDMYYEDIYSLPNKQLQCSVVTNYTDLSNKKRNSTFFKVLSITLASGIFLIAISAIGKISLPQLRKGEKHPSDHGTLLQSETETAMHQPVDASKVEAFCMSVVKRIKDTYDWPDDIKIEANLGAWIGEIPNSLKLGQENESGMVVNSSDSGAVEKVDADFKSTVQDIASYQVVLSTDGKIVGFQPTSRVGVNRWATNPLARELYGGGKLSPGLIEPSLNIQFPEKVVLIELLMSVNSETQFALARPIRRCQSA